MKKPHVGSTCHPPELSEMAILPKVIHRVNTILIKIPMILHRTRKHNSKIHTETQKATDSQNNPKQKERCWKDYNSRS